MNTDNNGKKYILIAEDDPAYASIYQTKLENEGFEVVIAENGDVALEQMRKRMPDLFVLDLVMSTKNGFEVLEQMHNDAALKNIKVIVASNLSQHADIEKVSSYHVLDYFVKSDVSITDVVEKIKQAIAA
ncbi:MAG: hypothetical protein Greene07144_1141 [Parcubacteria group bacterium Greene0714_4]|nr:MAG: hypothetical protein Greene101415_1165 [Parcubacteria group bacterium Greene1014_15]TSD06592.1 MAG: hypothetical protein Greene07144_1141 [Parcubacteria group bacterium Greene0714_4]